MNLLAALEQVVEEHDAASRALRNRFLDSQAAITARYRMLAEQRYAERMAREQDELDRHEQAELRRRTEAEEAERLSPADRDRADHTVYPSDWNPDAEEFPMPKSWLT